MTVRNTICKINAQKIKAKGAFTLIELLIVITIIGILATFVVASFNSALQKGRDAKRKADLNAISKAMEIVKGDCNGYYPTAGGGTPENAYSHWQRVSLNGTASNNYRGLKNYLATFGYFGSSAPDDPSHPSKEPPDSLGYSYWDERSPGSSPLFPCPNSQYGVTGYILGAHLENLNDPDIVLSTTTNSRCGDATTPNTDLNDATNSVNPPNYFVCNP